MLGVLDPEGAHLAALRRLADFSRARVLEVGCGDGRLTLEIAEHAESVFAFDLETLVPNGIILDLQVIRPDPRVEAVDGRLLCEADGTALFEYADAARDAADLLIRERLLEEEAVDDHDVMQH